MNSGCADARFQGKDGLYRVPHFGLNFVDAAEIAEVVEALLDTARHPPGTHHVPVVVTPNVDQIIHLDRNSDPIATELIRGAQWVLPDGQPIVWASRLLGRPLSARLAGSSLVALLWPAIIKAQRPTLVIAGSSEVATRVEEEGAAMGAIVAPQLSLSSPVDFSSFVDACCERARDLKPQFVFVGLGFPKQCNVIDGMLKRWPQDACPKPVFLAVGSSFEMYYEIVRRAPDWMQRSGLEWFFRFMQEPRRLFRRYFVDDLWFAALLLREVSTRKTGT